MKVLVLGAGVVGTASAWYLQRAGCSVTVLERQAEAGLETSFANGGQISVSHAEPWANPHALPQALAWLGREDAPLLFRPRADLALLRWSLAFVGNCLPGRTRANIRAIVNLALYSRARLQALRQELDLYVCLRPVQYFKGVPSPLKEPEKTNMVIFRENSEDIYAGIEFPAESDKAKKLIAFLQNELGATKIRLNSRSSPTSTARW